MQGAKLLQIGQQEIALGAKFKATVVLDCQARPVHILKRTEYSWALKYS